MRNRISKHIREEACIALQIMASDRAKHGEGSFGYFAIPGLSRGARLIASLAHAAAPLANDESGRPLYHIEYAEAEAMLRTGWTP